ncbi:MAG: hypothetical protein WA876_04430 [Candidatus Acidiferrales bacterium]
MRWIEAATMALAVAAVAGCSNSKPNGAASQAASASATPRSASHAAFNPCTLATQLEVSEAMGHASGPGQYHPLVGGRCNFYDARSQYEIFLQSFDVAGLLDSIAQMGGQRISGIGEKAVFSYGSLYVWKDGRGMQIGFLLPHPITQMTPAAEKLTKTIAGRM